ncbi:tRNA pseudouridine(55) synthase TruB [Magnetovibrio sp. PR-2]|uniref:tRNA pseudouridine(55) synthase TruB n=1 Tax=Magnetovibrio sp. PR-2 TaxID=3120356 RepID=UPI002FCE2544
MPRKRKGNPVHGWVVFDKPYAMSSSQAVGKVRWLLNAQKAGHGGTLDPLATGILPIALGEATKAMPYVVDSAKTYCCWIKFGESRTTDDAEGEIVETSDVRPTAEEIQAVLPEFEGEIEQIPPIYSAIKVDGQRAYKLARADQEVEMKPRRVTIDAIRLVEMPEPDLAIIDVDCQKGTYIRSLARDIALKLGTVGYVADLRRTRVGKFAENLAISLDSLEGLGHSARLEEAVLPLVTALDDIPALAVTEDLAKKVRHGNAIEAQPTLSSTDRDVQEGDTVVLMDADVPLALARIENGYIRPVRVLNL